MASPTKRAKEIADDIYTAYGTGGGYLFGIEPYKRSVVETIVQIVLEAVATQEAEKEATP